MIQLDCVSITANAYSTTLLVAVHVSLHLESEPIDYEISIWFHNMACTIDSPYYGMTYDEMYHEECT